MARAGRTSWPATRMAGLYLLIVCLMIWILPLFPAEPRLAPIFNHITHMVPPPFPLLLVVPALAIDLCRSSAAPAKSPAGARSRPLLSCWARSSWSRSLPCNGRSARRDHISFHTGREELVLRSATVSGVTRTISEVGRPNFGTPAMSSRLAPWPPVGFSPPSIPGLASCSADGCGKCNDETEPPLS